MPKIQLSDKAKAKIREALKEKDPMLWGVTLPSQSGTYLHLPLLELAQLPSIDAVVFVEDIKLVLEVHSGEDIESVEVDYLDGGVLSGVFEVKVKKIQDFSAAADDLDTSSPQVKKILEVLEKEINPAISSHGGFARLLDYQDGKVYLFMGGGCQGCQGASMTLKMGIETRLKEVVPEITEIIDQTDHASGVRPYF